MALFEEQGITCSMSLDGIWDHSTIDSLYGSLKTEHAGRKVSGRASNPALIAGQPSREQSRCEMVLALI
jgi:hypothetical protein